MNEWTTDSYIKIMGPDLLVLNATWQELVARSPSQRRYYLGEFVRYLSKLEANAKLLQAAMNRVEAEERLDKLPFERGE